MQYFFPVHKKGLHRDPGQLHAANLYITFYPITCLQSIYLTSYTCFSFLLTLRLAIPHGLLVT